MGSVLLVEESEARRQQLLLGLRGFGIEAGAVNGIAAARLVLEGGADVVIVIVGPGAGAVSALTGGVSGDERSAGRGSIGARPDVIALVEGDATAASWEAGLRAMREGAVDFVFVEAGAAGVALALRKRQAIKAALGGTEATARRGAEGAAHRPTSPPPPSLSPSPQPIASGPALVGTSPKIAAVLSLIRRLAGVRTGVLVGGESGTGKELVAQALHDQAPWRAGPFVAVNCGAIPAGLIESELFGHVRGAFTDAVRDKQGLFQAAHGGTLFLDEIADLPLGLQPKLLRVVQDGVVRRVGDSDDVRVQVRVVAATARDLTVEVAGRRFREDLYYRLAGMTIHLPPLRERRDDIPLLAAHFLGQVRARRGVMVNGIDADALALLVAYSWPGNVRELENTIERAAVLCADGRIDIASLPERMLAGVAVPAEGRSAVSAGDGVEVGLSIKQAARRSEEDLIRRALAVTGGNRTRAAALLEISHRALLYKIKEYGIVVATGRDPGERARLPKS